MTNSNLEDIIVLEAFEYVRTDRCEDYEAAGKVIDDKVRETEPGMLVHALTKVDQNAEYATYRWLEIFENANALAGHFASPHVKAHVAKLNEGTLTAPTKLVLYTGWSDAEKAEWQNKLGGDLEFAPVLAGYYLKR